MSTNDYNTKQNYADGNTSPTTLDQETLKQIENDIEIAAEKDTKNRGTNTKYLDNTNKMSTEGCKNSSNHNTLEQNRNNTNRKKYIKLTHT